MDDYKDRLLAAMKKAGLTTPKLAEKIGISYQAVKKVVDGKSAGFGIVNNVRAANILQVNSNWLVTGEGPMDIVTTSIQSSQAQSTRMVATIGPSLGDTLKHLSGYLVVLDARSRARVGQLLKDLAEEPDTHERITAIFQAEIDSGKRKAA